MSAGLVTSLSAEVPRGIRELLRSPGFAVLAVTTLSIGLGITTAMFAVMDALLFRPPFHVADADHVVRVQFRVRGEPSLIERTHYPHFQTLRASGAFHAVAAYTIASVSIGSGTQAELGTAMLVSTEFFGALGTTPHRGTFVTDQAGAADGGDRAIISHAFWQSRFAGTPTAVGSSLTIDRKTYVITGVTPPTFQGLSARPIDVWLPLEHASLAGVAPANWRVNARPFWLSLVARQPRGSNRIVSEQRATAVLHAQRAAGDKSPVLDVATASIVPGRGGNRTLEGRVSLWLSALSALVLLIACANVTNLFLVRAAMRQREHAVRLTLGASRWHLAWRVLFDTGTIVMASVALALLLSALIRQAVAGLLLGDIPLSRELLDPRTAAITTASGVLVFILVAAISLSQLLTAERRLDLLARSTHARGFGAGTRRILLAVQGCLCFILVFVAALFESSLRRVNALDLGVELDQTIQLSITGGGSVRSADENRRIFESIRAELSRHPAVERVTLTEGSPFMSGSGAGPWTRERSAKELWGQGNEVAYRSAVGSGFFATVGARTLRGRDITTADTAGAERIAVINAPLAKYLWPGKDALGECMWLDDEPSCLRIVGVQEGVWKFRMLERNQMAVYLPLAQAGDSVPSAVFIRPRGDAREFLPQVRAIVQTLYPDLPAVRAVIVRDVADPESRPWRLGTVVFTAMGAVALLIASVGLYSIVAMGTTARIKELGIRTALGARWRHLTRVVVWEGLGSVGIGLLVGAVAVAGISDWLAGALYQTPPRDPAIFIETVIVMLGVSVAAVVTPAVRAIILDPATVLRSE
ncbi:MAG: ABC transporter permease [Cyanobacteria bacterium]|nr:ABC transporter permease [Cyanobacteriota bacterium]